MEFKERPTGLFIGVSFFLLCAAYVLWDGFIEGTREEFSVRDLDGGVVSWLLLAACLGMAFVGALRLGIWRLRVTIAGDDLKIVHYNRRHVVKRSEVSELRLDRGAIQLVRPSASEVLVIYPQQYEGGSSMFSALEEWRRSDGEMPAN